MYVMVQWWLKVIEIGGSTNNGACVSTHTLGGLAPGKSLKLGALRLLLRPYLYPNVTSQTRVYGGSNAIVRHDTRQSSH